MWMYITVIIVLFTASTVLGVIAELQLSKWLGLERR